MGGFTAHVNYLLLPLLMNSEPLVTAKASVTGFWVAKIINVYSKNCILIKPAWSRRDKVQQ